MRIIIFLFIEIVAFWLVMDYIKVVLFFHFSKKIKYSIKKIFIKPYIKNKKLNLFIRNNDFKLLGLRKESIFKLFSNKYILYKNDKNIFLDVYKSQKYSYFSFMNNGIINMLFSSNINTDKLEGEDFNIGNYMSFDDLIFQDSEEIDRNLISEKYYGKISFVSKFNLIASYLVITVFIAQFFYMILKWL